MEKFQCCDKSEKIRLLSLYLRETQAQYIECFSEAAEQDSRLELQRDCIESLQKKIICKDLVYYALLIKVQEFFRGRIADVRLVRSKMDGLLRSKKSLESKCRRIHTLWREADRELRKIKCINCCESISPQLSQCRDSATSTDAFEFNENTELQAQLNFLLRENEELKRQLKARGLDFDIFDEEVKDQLNEKNLRAESIEETSERENRLIDENLDLESVLKEHLAHARTLIDELQTIREKEAPKINSQPSSQDRDEFKGPPVEEDVCRGNVELNKLVEEPKDKQEELGIMHDMKKQFQKSEGLDRLNQCMKEELTILRQTAENKYCAREKSPDNSNFQGNEIRSQDREVHMIKELKDQLSTTRELTEECLAELRVSKEMLSFLRERICSLKRLLNEKSGEMAKLQADHEMMKNDYSILKSENSIFGEKSRAEIQKFREKLKALQSELHLVDENYRRVSQDFDRSQKLLIEAARREVEIQRGITAMEQIFYSKLTSAEREGKRLSDLVDVLRADLENARGELSAREEDFTEKCRDAYEQVETLEDRVALLEDSKYLLKRQLQECRLENCRLRAENNRLMENGCRCIQELEDTHSALLELMGECKTKTETLNSVSAELNNVAASRSEVCEESQRVVACVRGWIEEQRRLVENMSKKLKNEKNRIARYAFEKKALVATVKELTRVNGTLSEFSMRRKLCQGQKSPNRRCARSNGYQTPASYSKSQKPVSNSSTTVYNRPLKRRCVCLTKTSRRTLLRGNSWWFPKLEHVSKELCCKNHRRGRNENMNERRLSETSTDEARDFGYQSSASK